jgi:hypothetical protein
MKKVLLTLSLIVLLVPATWAIDGAEGVGKYNSKLEIGYLGGSFDVLFNYGLTTDLTVYGIFDTFTSVSGLGVGAKYAIFNEKKGDKFSLSAQLGLLMGGSGSIVAPGAVISKQLNSKLTVLGDVQVRSSGPLNYTWAGGGVLFNINEHFQVGGEIGLVNVIIDHLGQRWGANGVGLGLGLNYAF